MSIFPVTKSLSYEDHLAMKDYVADINKGIARASRDNLFAQAASAKIIAETMDRNADFISQTIADGSDRIAEALEYGLEEVAEGISGLRADFDVRMGQVLAQFEMMREEMRMGLNNIAHLLENRRKTEAQEHLLDALEFYNNGCKYPNRPQWFRDALRHLHSCVEQYEMNPIAHLHIGHIHHYTDEFKDFKKALEHYELALTYGEADEKQHAVAAQGGFYGGWLSAAVFGDLSKAVKMTRSALNLDQSLSEAHYHLAKFYSARGDTDSATVHLRTAIVEFDRKYCLKAASDPDFDVMRGDIETLFKELRSDAQRHLSTLIARLNRGYDPHDKQWRRRLANMFESLDSLAANGAYFACLDAVDDVDRLKQMLADAEDAKHKFCDPADELIAEITGFIDTHTALSKVRSEELAAALQEARVMLASDDHLTAEKARDKLLSVLGRTMTYTKQALPRQLYSVELDGLDSIYFSPDSRFLVVIGKRSFLFDMVKEEELTDGYFCRLISSPKYVAFNTGGNRMACFFDGLLYQYDTRSQELVSQSVLKGLPTPRFAAFSPSDEIVAGLLSDGKIYLWDARTGNYLNHFGDFGDFPFVAFDKDGQTVVTANSNGKIRFWDPRTGNVLRYLDVSSAGNRINSIAISRDLRRAATGGSDAMVRVWDIAHKEPVEKFIGRGHYGEILTIAFSYDGGLVASGGRDATVRLWDARAGVSLDEFDGRIHSEPVRTVCFSPCGTYLMSGSNEYPNPLAMWNSGWLKRQSSEISHGKEKEMSKGLCIICGAPISFMLRLKGSEYCKKHSQQ